MTDPNSAPPQNPHPKEDQQSEPQEIQEVGAAEISDPEGEEPEGQQFQDMERRRTTNVANHLNDVALGFDGLLQEIAKVLPYWRNPSTETPHKGILEKDILVCHAFAQLWECPQDIQMFFPMRVDDEARNNATDEERTKSMNKYIKFGRHALRVGDMVLSSSGVQTFQEFHDALLTSAEKVFAAEKAVVPSAELAFCGGAVVYGAQPSLPHFNHALLLEHLREVIAHAQANVLRTEVQGHLQSRAEESSKL